MNKSPYQTIKHRLVTEKARVLEGLQHSSANASVRKCEKPKYVFIVDRNANKQEIKLAIEHIYASKKVKVISVNTVNIRPKKKRVRGRLGKTSWKKKAIVTMEPGDNIDDQV